MMAHPISVGDAAKEVGAADVERKAAREAATRIEMELWEAQRRVELAQIRYEEATRVLIEVSSE